MPIDADATNPRKERLVRNARGRALAMMDIPERPLSLCVAVTAHRDLVESEIPSIESRIEELFQDLAADFPELPLLLLTPLASGGDQLAARVAQRLGIPFAAILPMEPSEYEKDFDSANSLSEFRAFLDQAAWITHLPGVAGTEAPYDDRQRAMQYAQLGVFLSNHCQVLLALWDGSEGDHLGGTGQVVRYHLTAMMPGFEADAFPASLLAENENDLVYHIVCSRDRPDGAPATGLRPLDAGWFSSRDGGARSDTMPVAYQLLLNRLQGFAHDWRGKDAQVARYSSSLLADRPQLEPVSGSATVDRFFQVADGLAVHYQRRVHGALRAIYLLAMLMGLDFIIYSEADGPGYMVLLFLALFLAGVAVHLVGERRQWHRKYLDYRTLAEGLRVQLYWNLSGVIDPDSVEFAHDNFLQQQDIDLGWIRHVMRQASLFRERGRPPDDRWVDWVIDQWVGNPDAAQGQLAYYSRKELENSLRYNRINRLGSLALWTGIAIAVALYFLGSESEAGERNLLMILMGTLPLIAGVWDAYSHKRAEKELIKQYGFMGRVFGRARELLDGSNDIGFRRRVLRALGQAALEEGAEWLLLHRERPPEPGGL